ncbi:MAG TPA: glycosyltransferase family 2 protein [Bacteroidales bacterium]|nr:glycosyltransferase family 2 protein [Bacteroidales bacterium]
MISHPQISCVIPFWNEGTNIFPVLDEISKVSFFSEIICVDDASDDNNHITIAGKYPDIRIIRLKKNLGKSGAVKEGIRHASGNYIMLIDADLRNLNHAEIDLAIRSFLKAEDLDMLILRRVNAFFFVKLYRADVLFTGERLLSKKDLELILESSDIRGWQLESAINTWMLLNDKNVAWIAHSGINRHKYIKWGILKGFWLDLKTYKDMITAGGIYNILRQLLFFAKRELKPEMLQAHKFQSEREFEEVH